MSKTRALALVTVGLQLAGLMVVAAAPPAAAGPSFPPSEWVIGPQKRVAIITIDGQTKWPNFRYVLDKLEAHKATASFFVSGSWIDNHRKKARLLRTEGHVLGNRGYSQAKLTSLDDGELRNGIAGAQKALNSIGAHPRPFLRPPKGARDERVLRVAGSMGYRSVRWTDHPGGGVAKKVARRAVRRARAGSIISLDVWRKSHRQALGKIIDGLRRKHFDLRTIETLERAHAVRWDMTLSQGSGGPEVRYLQKTLGSISYPAGKHDGSFGYATYQATIAFEKTNRMDRDGVVDPHEMTRIALAKRPRTPTGKGKSFIDIDIGRQVLFEVRKKRVINTIPISSGNEEYYEQDGQTYKAHTPRGDFIIERKIPGWRTSRLGRLYYPSYFIGGFAIHGSESVPTHPASHGCVRIPMYVARPFYNRNPIGRPTYVHN
ncbi:MAG TPA: polysaccharide deacetylase family protein [Actinomycetota bacterium]|jgi:peptidoglycan/xylan/chitin deacetylase (PgdA/CDA1 family)/lipoprotein-anchoring transpeptidase ErfK/SrfK